MCQEFVDGLRISFDFILPVLLLYEPEREQHNKLMNVYKCKSPAKQKIPAEDSPLLRSPRSRSSEQNSHHTEEPWPKLPKLSPNVVEEDEGTFNQGMQTPTRVTRSRGTESTKKSELDPLEKAGKSEGHVDVKPDKSELAKQIKKRRSSDRQEKTFRCRALRSYRKSSEDSSDSEQSKPDTIMSEPVKPAVKNEKPERPPPLLIPCNVLLSRSNGINKVPEKGASSSTDSMGDNGREEILANILQWQLAPPEALNKLPTPPCMLYGSFHLLRLFVKLPSLLSQMDLDEDRLGVLKKLLHQFLQYLSEHVNELFPDAAYVKESSL